MTTAKLTAASLALVAALSFTTNADAGHGCKVRVNPAPVITHPPVSNDWYFGMSVVLRHTGYGQGLQVHSVSPYSPAAHVGLEPGDIILSANSSNFHYARTNNDGVRILQQSVSTYGGAPAPTATFSTQPVSTLVNPGAGATQGAVQLQVLDSRSGRVVSLTIYPEYRGYGHGGAPAPTATFSR